MVSTIHPRIALTRDPELDEALRRDAYPAERSTEEVLTSAAKLGAPDARRPYAISHALEQQRDERL
jgi:hypothetical protein